MPYRLISYDRVPPGEFFYRQTDGVSKSFGATPDISALARRVGSFRAGNSLSRSDYLSCLEDIDTFTCNRLNNSSQFCYQTDIPFDQLHPVGGGGGCSSCGANLSP